jgi:hypothetical protein
MTKPYMASCRTSSRSIFAAKEARRPKVPPSVAYLGHLPDVPSVGDLADKCQIAVEIFALEVPADPLGKVDDLLHLVGADVPEHQRGHLVGVHAEAGGELLPLLGEDDLVGPPAAVLPVADDPLLPEGVDRAGGVGLVELEDVAHLLLGHGALREEVDVPQLAAAHPEVLHHLVGRGHDRPVDGAEEEGHLEAQALGDAFLGFFVCHSTG